jgi:hypothetical protein
MGRLKFAAAGHKGQVCEVFGREFPHGAWVDADGMDLEHARTLARNPAFEAEDIDLEDPAPDPEPVKTTRTRKAKSTSDQTPVTSDTGAEGGGPPAP